MALSPICHLLWINWVLKTYTVLSLAEKLQEKLWMSKELNAPAKRPDNR